MNNNIRLSVVQNRLRQENISSIEFKLQCGWKILLCEYGGRVFGPFKDDSESIFWMNDVFNSEKQFHNFVKDREWNIGGDRFWLAPELPFFVKNKNDFFGSYTVQDQLDPGEYRISEFSDSLNPSHNSVTAYQSIELDVFESYSKSKKLSMSREILKAKNPISLLDSAKDVESKVEYFGFCQNILLEDESDDDLLYLEPWLLTQINPCGDVIIPYIGEGLEYVNYYEPIPDTLLSVSPKYAKVSVTGDTRYKIGIKSTQSTGRSAYIGHFSNGDSYLFVRTFFSNPSNIYCSGPYFEPESYGCSLYVYNDPGSQGGFAEFENCGTTISGDLGTKFCSESVYYYFFVGKKEDLMRVATLLL